MTFLWSKGDFFARLDGIFVLGGFGFVFGFGFAEVVRLDEFDVDVEDLGVVVGLGGDILDAVTLRKINNMLL